MSKHGCGKRPMTTIGIGHLRLEQRRISRRALRRRRYSVRQRDVSHPHLRRMHGLPSRVATIAFWVSIKWLLGIAGATGLTLERLIADQRLSNPPKSTPLLIGDDGTSSWQHRHLRGCT